MTHDLLETVAEVYNSLGITAAAAAIEDLGGAAGLLVNHGHEAMYGHPHLKVPVHVGRADRAELARGMAVSAVLDGRSMLGDDLEVISVPGHTPGSTAFLWDSGTHRFLFTGDTLWSFHGEWQTVVLGTSSRSATLESLALIRDLDFDVLVPWAAVAGEPVAIATDPVSTRARLGAVIDRFGAGADR